MIDWTQEELKKQIHYDPLTGVFTRISKPKGSRALLGIIKGSSKKEGHLKLCVFGKEVYFHRLAWFYMYGVWPTDIIDHINGDPTDNRIVNLREVDRLGNLHNQVRPHKTNKSGYLGVYFKKDKNKYCAEILVKGKKKHLGYFLCPKEAHEAYVIAKRELHPTCTL